MIILGDFRDHRCPDGASLILVDPPYGLSKKYQQQPDHTSFEIWVQTLYSWWVDSDCPRLMIFSPGVRIADWLPKVPPPDRWLWWHRTFLTPGMGSPVVPWWSPSMTPILCYESSQAPWYGPTRTEREWHDVVHVHSAIGDSGRHGKVGQKPKHPGTTGTQIATKIIEPLTLEGDLVVDPMCGIGSIPIAAMRLGRKYHGIEIQKEYVDFTERWIQYELGRSQKPVGRRKKAQ